MEKIEFTFQDTNETVDFYILEETKINGTQYLLVTDSDDEEEEEGEAYILKDLSSETDEESVYEMVEDDEELAAVSKIFAEELEDYDIEL